MTESTLFQESRDAIPCDKWHMEEGFIPSVFAASSLSGQCSFEVLLVSFWLQNKALSLFNRGVFLESHFGFTLWSTLLAYIDGFTFSTDGFLSFLPFFFQPCLLLFYLLRDIPYLDSCLLV